MRLGIGIVPGAVRAVAVHKGVTIWAAEASWATADDLATVLAGLAAERPRAVRRVRVTLGDGVVSVKTLEALPGLNPKDLAAHVQLHASRYFLQNGVPVITAAESLGAGRARIGGALLTVIEAVHEGLANAGMRCQSVAPAAELSADLVTITAEATEPLEPALRLEPAGHAKRRRSADARALGRLVAAQLTALLVWAATWAWAQRSREQNALAEIERNRALIESALSHRRDLDDADAALGVIAGMDARRAPAGRFLADLTRSLPDSAFVVNVRLEEDGSGTLTGYAPRATALLAALERGRVVRGGRFEGPIIRELIAGRELERFNFRFQSR